MSISGLFAVERSAAMDDGCQGCKAGRLNFRTFEPVLHLSRWAEEEKQLPLSLL